MINITKEQRISRAIEILVKRPILLGQFLHIYRLYPDLSVFFDQNNKDYVEVITNDFRIEYYTEGQLPLFETHRTSTVTI